MDPNTAPAAPDPTPDHIEPAAEMLGQADAGILAAMDAALTGEPAATVNEPDATATTEPSATTEGEPAAGDATPDAATEVQPTAAKPDEAVEGATEGEKRPSDEFGELPKDAKAETRERFDTLKTKYDEVHRERDTVTRERDDYKAQAEQWVNTVQSTGASPEQFGSALQYLQAVNSGTPEGLQAAYDIMSKELEALGKMLGREVPGVHDPLADHPDLQQRVEDRLIDRSDALEIAQARQSVKLREQTAAQRTQADTLDRAAQDGLRAVQALGAELRAADPAGFEARTAALKPTIDRVIAKLPPDEWESAIRDLYATVPAAPKPAPAPAPAPAVTTTLRPTSAPAGGGLSKTPGSAFEAMEAALGNL